MLLSVGAATGCELLQAFDQFFVYCGLLRERLLVLLIELGDFVLMINELLVEAVLRPLCLLLGPLEMKPPSYSKR